MFLNFFKRKPVALYSKEYWKKNKKFRDMFQRANITEALGMKPSIERNSNTPFWVAAIIEGRIRRPQVVMVELSE